MKKKKSLKKELIEWGIFFGIIIMLYATGLHAPVFGFVQGLVLKTGLIKPKIERQSDVQANYQFTLVDEEGTHIPFDQFRNQVVFINFWATWCPPCLAEMPDIHDLYQKMEGTGVRFVMVALDEEFDKALKYKQKKHYSFPIYRLNSPLPTVFQSRSIPTTFVIDANGAVVVKKSGMAQYDSQQFREFLKDLAAS